MKATELLEKIRENLKDYPIDYLKNKATDDRYPDSITKRLAIYNSGIYDEIYGNEIEEDFEIRDSIIKNIEDDVDYYFSIYDPGDIETRDFTRELSLYLVLIAKKQSPCIPSETIRKKTMFTCKMENSNARAESQA